ncbi:MAG: TlpA family protein disulfide reductase [Acidimicrobiia bacterium]
MDINHRGARRFTVGIAAGAFVLASCGGGGDASSPVTSPTQTAASAQPAPSAAGAAPANANANANANAATPAGIRLVGAKTVNGAAFDPATLAGKPTVAWFWAPWCTVCRAEAPEISATVAKYQDRVNFVGIAGLGKAPEMRKFVSETRTSAFVHLDDTNGTIWKAYGIYAQPSFAFITAGGRVQTFTGSLDAKSLAKVIDQLIVA